MGSAHICIHFAKMWKVFFKYYWFGQCPLCCQSSGINVSVLCIDFTLEPIYLLHAIVLAQILQLVVSLLNQTFFFPGSLQGSKISKAIQNSSCLNASSNYTMNADRNCSKTSVIWRSHLKFVSPDRGLALGGRLKAYCCTWWTISSKYFFLNHLFLPALRFSNFELVRWT